MFKKSIISIFLLLSLIANSQNWTTIHGNNERNGKSNTPGPQSITTPIWTITNATYTASGINIYSFGDRFVNSRVNYSPYSAIIECRDLTTGELVWISPDLGADSILYLMGFNEDAVYAHDYNSMLFYSLNPEDGSIKWVAPQTSYTFARTDGVILTCERNIIINGVASGDDSTVCLDKETGDILWANTNSISVTPNNIKAAHNDKLYLVTGAMNQPKKLVAVDIGTGENLYYSDEIPGGALQQDPISISPDGTIYLQRDTGDLFAIEDSGSDFSVLWTYTPINQGSFVFNNSFDNEGNPLILDDGKVQRLDKTDGSLLGSSIVNSIENGRITIGSDSVIYVNNYDNRYYALSYDLQTTIWEKYLNSIYDAGPAFSKDGIMVMAGSGTTIIAYQYDGQHAPVSDFIADSYILGQNNSLNFTDQSSFQPTSWYWEFSGGTPATSTDQNPTNIFYNTTGIFDVSLTTTNSSGSNTTTKHCLIEVFEATGLVEINEEEVFTVYPNPASNRITIKTEVTTKSIEIYNSIGQIVITTKNKDIEVTNLENGIYFITIQTESGNFTKKIIINK